MRGVAAAWRRPRPCACRVRGRPHAPPPCPQAAAAACLPGDPRPRTAWRRARKARPGQPLAGGGGGTGAEAGRQTGGQAGKNSSHGVHYKCSSAGCAQRSSSQRSCHTPPLLPASRLTASFMVSMMSAARCATPGRARLRRQRRALGGVERGGHREGPIQPASPAEATLRGQEKKTRETGEEPPRHGLPHPARWTGFRRRKPVQGRGVLGGRRVCCSEAGSPNPRAVPSLLPFHRRRPAAARGPAPSPRQPRGGPGPKSDPGEWNRVWGMSNPIFITATRAQRKNNTNTASWLAGARNFRRGDASQKPKAGA